MYIHVYAVCSAIFTLYSHTRHLSPPACPATGGIGNLAWIIPVAVVAGLLVLGVIILLIVVLIVCLNVSVV